ncbi:MAG: helix-turn-helix domain-containing protein, partial [Myxococcota bacterium]
AATLCGDRITADYMRAELEGSSEPRVMPASVHPETTLPSSEEEAAGVHAVLKAPIEDPSGASVPLREAKDQLVSDFERRYIEHLLDKHDQNISAAAREAQVDRRHLYRLLKKYGLMK